MPADSNSKANSWSSSPSIFSETIRAKGARNRRTNRNLPCPKLRIELIPSGSCFHRNFVWICIISCPFPSFKMLKSCLETDISDIATFRVVFRTNCQKFTYHQIIPQSPWTSHSKRTPTLQSTTINFHQFH